MPVQQINVKNSADIESFEWAMSAGGGGAAGVQGRAGSGSSHTSYSNSSGDICRICHCESDSHNPLLAPCYCSGSLKYVHQSCLQQWLTASETRSCELCKFNFIMHTKIKPFNEWRLLEMSGVERRRLCCAVLFHCVAALCVMWSLFVLIERAVEEVNRGIIAWPFWTKLAVVAVGFTGGAVFMYIQCRQYLHLCNRWRAHNRILLIQNAPDKLSVAPPSPMVQHVPMQAARGKRERSSQGQVVANIENDPHNSNNAVVVSPRSLQQLHVEHHAREAAPAAAEPDEDDSGGFESYTYKYRRVSSVNEHKPYARTPDQYADLPENRRFSDTRLVQGFNPHVPPPPPFNTVHHIDEVPKRSLRYVIEPIFTPSERVYHISDQLEGAEDRSVAVEQPQVSDIQFELVPRIVDPLEFNISEMLELDARSTQQRRNRSFLSLNREQPTAHKSPPNPADKAVFKSLPNLSASCENLLPQKAGS